MAGLPHFNGHSYASAMDDVKALRDAMDGRMLEAWS